MHTVEDAVDDRRYAVTVGARLRAIRGQKRLSLQDVEARSDEEFKASVLGAYERGERAISVARLQRLARFYEVPVDQLLPRDGGPAFGAGDVADGDRAGAGPTVADAHLRIDLGAVTKLGPDGAPLLRFVRTIQVQRGDFNGKVLTLRSSDLSALACLLDVDPAEATARLDTLGVTFVPPPV